MKTNEVVRISEYNCKPVSFSFLVFSIFFNILFFMISWSRKTRPWNRKKSFKNSKYTNIKKKPRRYNFSSSPYKINFMIVKIFIKMDGQQLMKRNLVSMLVIGNLKEKNLKLHQSLVFKLLKRANISLNEKYL